MVFVIIRYLLLQTETESDRTDPGDAPISLCVMHVVFGSQIETALAVAST